MRNIFIIGFLCMGVGLSAQWIDPWQIRPAPDSNMVLGSITPWNDAAWVYRDSLLKGIPVRVDSLFLRNDTIFLRDGSGYAKVTVDSLINRGQLSLSNDTLYYKPCATCAVWVGKLPAPSIKTVNNNSLLGTGNVNVGNVRGNGVATRVAYWATADSLTHDANFVRYPTSLDLFNTKLNIQSRDGVGNWNVFINGGNGTTTGADNIAIGSNQTLQNVTNGVRNLAFGTASGVSTTTGSDNVFLSYLSGYTNTTGSNNMYIGNSAGYLTNASDNTFIGNSAGRNSTSGQSLYLGTFAGYNTTANRNVSIGFYSSFSGSNTGERNVILGAQASQNGGGSNNVKIGWQSGFTGAGSSNVFLGVNSGYNESGSNRLYIENTNSNTPLIGGRFDTDRIGINTHIDSISQTLHVTGTARITGSTSTATTIMGRDGIGNVSNIALNGLSITGGTLSVTDASKWNQTGNDINNKNSGNVGIGTTTPAYKLDVTGDLRITDRTGTAITGAGFDANGKLVQYSLDTSTVTPETYINAGMYIGVSGIGSNADPYVITNTRPENTKVNDSGTIDFTLTGDTITAVVKDGSIIPAKLDRTYITTEVDGSIFNEGQMTLSGAFQPFTYASNTTSSDALIMNSNTAGITITRAGNELTWTNTGDLSITNELQDLYGHSTGFVLDNPTAALNDTVLFTYVSSINSTPPTSCNCGIGDIPTLLSTLNSKSDTSHQHPISDVMNLQSTLDAKANTTHTHVISDVTGLQTAIDAKENAFNKGSLIAGTNVTLLGTLTNRLVGSGDVTINATGGGVQLFEDINASGISFTNSTIALNLSLAAGTYKLDCFCRVNNEMATTKDFIVTLSNSTTSTTYFTSNSFIPAFASTTIPVARNVTLGSTNNIRVTVSTEAGTDGYIQPNSCLLTALKVN